MSDSGKIITNVSEAKASLSKLIQRALEGKEVIIGRAGKPVVMLVPYVEDARPRELGGSWRGAVEIADDFDDALPEEIQSAFVGDESAS